MTPQDNIPELKWSVLKVLTAKAAVTPRHGKVSYYLKWSVRKVLTAQGISLFLRLYGINDMYAELAANLAVSLLL